MIDNKSQREKFYVTHFVVEPPPEEGLRRLSFLTASNSSLLQNKFFSGFGTHRPFELKDLRLKIDSGSILKLPKVESIDFEKGLWMNSSGDVLMADKRDPLSDSNIKTVFNANLLNIKSVKLKSASIRLKSVSELYSNSIGRDIDKFRQSATRVAPPSYNLTLAHAE